MSLLFLRYLQRLPHVWGDSRKWAQLSLHLHACYLKLYPVTDLSMQSLITCFGRHPLQCPAIKYDTNCGEYHCVPKMISPCIMTMHIMIDAKWKRCDRTIALVGVYCWNGLSPEVMPKHFKKRSLPNNICVSNNGSWGEKYGLHAFHWANAWCNITSIVPYISTR